MNAEQREIVLDVLYGELRNTEREYRESMSNDDPEAAAQSWRYVNAISAHIDELEAEDT